MRTAPASSRCLRFWAIDRARRAAYSSSAGQYRSARLARALEKKPIQVKLLDKNQERCAVLANGDPDRGLHGDGTDQEVLQRKTSAPWMWS